MITQSNIDNLYKISSNLAMKDYLRMNPKKSDNTPKYKNHIPYSLSEDTIEAKNLYGIAINKEVTIEQEEQIKAYLLKVKMLFPQLLEENQSYRQWKNASNY